MTWGVSSGHQNSHFWVVVGIAKLDAGSTLDPADGLMWTAVLVADYRLSGGVFAWSLCYNQTLNKPATPTMLFCNNWRRWQDLLTFVSTRCAPWDGRTPFRSPRPTLTLSNTPRFRPSWPCFEVTQHGAVGTAACVDRFAGGWDKHCKGGDWRTCANTEATWLDYHLPCWICSM